VKGFTPIHYKIPGIFAGRNFWAGYLLLMKTFSRGKEISQLALISAFAITVK